MCTLEKHGDVFILTLTGSSDLDEHRFSPPVIDSILAALSQARAQATPGSVLITSSHGKFFSNGFDLAWAQAAGSRIGARERLHHMVEIFKPIVAAMISLPMPTVAAVNGHAAGAGFALVLSHDYALMRGDKGVLYMSEVDIGLTLPDYFAALFRAKIGSALVRRDILLRATKIKGEEAVKMGIVDSAHDSMEEVTEASLRLGKELASRKWSGEVYAEIRKSLYPELCGVLGLVEKAVVANSRF
ncbi:enoyl-CoA delta isomerase 2, peroxisomal-like [Mangifera indica]|uniref:enoyl-CoA delta isomerase 2, peroxisomal-like n=1 Tax=Mangifera indica TaxID=29780 RepID=UPI001CFADF00|nr:enoyl-CoA delta isomerase 2, peroxisomal-like [Mangifera indica]XP_044486274.1 enoyl-CoA delta isomerase 2, peroxisomal-like [Mangifera indica]